MGQRTKIEYVHHTWNPIRGCEHALLPDGSEHPGCANCYAEAMAKRNPRLMGTWGSAGDGGTRVVGVDAYWSQLARWNQAARQTGERRRVMVSAFDPFEQWRATMHSVSGYPLYVCNAEQERWVEYHGRDRLLPIERENLDRGVFRPLTMDDCRRRMFREIAQCDWLDVLLFTKRPDRASISQRIPSAWLVVSASDQATFRWAMEAGETASGGYGGWGISLEPLLGPVVITPRERQPDWIIVGGESGPKARPCFLEWIQGVQFGCESAGIPCFTKQAGSFAVTSNVNLWDWSDRLFDPEITDWGTWAASGRVRFGERKGGDPEEWPDGFDVREFPAAAGA